jgi:hypothetical protein
MKNLEEIEKHNEEAAAGKQTYTFGVNKFTDLTHEEFARQYTGIEISQEELTNTKTNRRSDHVRRRQSNADSKTPLPDNFGKYMQLN